MTRNTFKKITALFLSLMLCLASGSPVFAMKEKSKDYIQNIDKNVTISSAQPGNAEKLDKGTYIEDFNSKDDGTGKDKIGMTRFLITLAPGEGDMYVSLSTAAKAGVLFGLKIPTDGKIDVNSVDLPGNEKAVDITQNGPAISSGDDFKGNVAIASDKHHLYILIRMPNQGDDVSGPAWDYPTTGFRFGDQIKKLFKNHKMKADYFVEAYPLINNPEFSEVKEGKDIIKYFKNYEEMSKGGEITMDEDGSTVVAFTDYEVMPGDKAKFNKLFKAEGGAYEINSKKRMETGVIIVAAIIVVALLIMYIRYKRKKKRQKKIDIYS